MNNIFSSIPADIPMEICEDLLQNEHIRIERILSQGQSSPPDSWYDQDENEWGLVLKGSGIVVYDDGSQVKLETGDYLNIPAHKKHRVSWTDPDRVTVWLAIFYN